MLHVFHACLQEWVPKPEQQQSPAFSDFVPKLKEINSHFWNVKLIAAGRFLSWTAFRSKPTTVFLLVLNQNVSYLHLRASTRMSLCGVGCELSVKAAYCHESGRLFFQLSISASLKNLQKRSCDCVFVCMCLCVGKCEEHITLFCGGSHDLLQKQGLCLYA